MAMTVEVGSLILIFILNSMPYGDLLLGNDLLGGFSEKNEVKILYTSCLSHAVLLTNLLPLFFSLAGLAFMFSTSILLQIVACVVYGNWWPMLSALMYVLVPMPCLFFGGGSTQFLISRDGGGWMDAAKFLTGASAVGSVAIPIILRHAGLIGTGAMFIEFTSFFIFACTVLCFHRASLDDEW